MTGREIKAAFLAGAVLAGGIAAPAHADTLREALAQAYVNNPDLQAARAQQRANDENVAIERAAGRPSVNGNAQYTEFLRQSSNSFTAPERQFGAGATLGVPLYQGGAVKNSIRAAQERVRAGRADLRGTESAIFSAVVAAYMDVLRSQALVGLSLNQVDVLTINLEATSDRYQIGDLTRTDVAQSESRLSLAQGDLRGAQANLINARENYIELVGSAPDDLQPPPPLPGLPGTVEEAVDVALEYNPDLIAARDRADAAGYDIEVAGASRLPRVEGFVGGDYSNFLGTLGSGTVGVPLSQAQTTAQAGVRATLPIYQGGRPAALQRQATAFATAALENVIATEREVIAQVRAAYSSWQASLAIIESSQDAVDAAELSLEGVRAENTVGNRTILDILNAEQELLLTRVELVTARRNAYVAGFTLLAAMGRAEARDLALEGTGPLYDPVVNYNRVQGQWNDWQRDPDPAPTTTRTIDIEPQTADIPAYAEAGEISGD